MNHRPYRSEKDYDLMRRLITDTLALNGPPAYLTVGELDWFRCRSIGKDSVKTVELWIDDRGGLGGFAWLQGRSLDMFTHPARRSIERDMLAWGEEKLRSKKLDEGTPRTLKVWSLTRDTSRITLFNRLEYRQTHEHFTFNFRNLNEAIPEIKAPEGYIIRPVKLPDELTARVDVHKEAFAPSSMTPQKYRSLTRFPSYKTAIDLVAVAPDGSLAAFCVAWYDERNRHVALEPVGCHPAHQRKGLAKAVCASALHTMNERGAKSASVFCWWEDTGPQKLYESLGFEDWDHVVQWEHPVF